MKHTKITVQINVSHYFNNVFSYLNSVGFFYLKTYKTFLKILNIFLFTKMVTLKTLN